jgi:cation diffusion facilitator family transporter
MVARERRQPVLTSPPDAASRSRAQMRVLRDVLLLNLGVAVSKIVFGAWSGAVSILSDGFHSLTDSASNVIAIVGVRAARQPADPSHPYGHRKFETLAAGAILIMLVVAMVQIVEASLSRLADASATRVTALSFVVMIGTLMVNLFVVRYESRQARRLRSEVLLADSRHTWSDVLTSIAVIGALVGVWLGWPILDPLVALVVAGFIGRAGYDIARQTVDVLADRAVLDTVEVRRVVSTVPEVVGCHEIRSRGSIDHAFLDLHLWFRPDMRLDEAHRLSHEVKDRLLAAFPELQDVVIHLEPGERERGA